MSEENFRWPYVKVPDVSKGFGCIDDEQAKALGNQLIDGFKQCGFVLLKNTGFPQSKQISQIVSEGKKFIQLPEGVKSAVCEEKYKAYFVGHLPFQYESLGRYWDGPMDAPKDFRECICFNPSVPWNFPREMGTMEQDLRDVHKQLSAFTLFLYECIALSLGKDRRFFDQMHKNLINGEGWNNTNLRINLSPPTHGKDMEEKQCLCGEHMDMNSLTLIVQEPGMAGLMCRLPSGRWVSIPDEEDSLVLQVGYGLELQTGGLVKACRHKVEPFKDERSKRERHSVAFFIGPDNDASMAPINGGTYNEHSAETFADLCSTIARSLTERKTHTAEAQ